MPEIRCKHCQALLKVPLLSVGKTVSCPKCQQMFVATPDITKVTARPANRKSGGKGRPPGNNWPLIILGVLMALGGFAGAAGKTLTATPAVIALCGIVLCLGAMVEGHLDRIRYYLKRADERASGDEA